MSLKKTGSRILSGFSILLLAELSVITLSGCSEQGNIFSVQEDNLNRQAATQYPFSKGFNRYKDPDFGVYIDYYITDPITEDIDVALVPIGTYNKPAYATIDKISSPLGTNVAKVNGGLFTMPGFDFATRFKADPTFDHRHYGSIIRGGSIHQEGSIQKLPDNGYCDFVYTKQEFALPVYKDGSLYQVRTYIDNWTTAKALETAFQTSLVFGSSYSLVENGRVGVYRSVSGIGQPSSSTKRTIVGAKLDGSFVLAVTEGGLTANQEAEVAAKLGCWNAVNLDGGGSTQMWANNSMKYSVENRPVTSAIVVYKKNSVVNRSVEGYIKSGNGVPRSGFKVEIEGYSQYAAISSSNGYFKISDIQGIPSFNIKVSKTGYLTRTIKNISSSSDIIIGTSSTPMEIWCGDLNLDGSINMQDVMLASASFNTVKGDAKYNSSVDLNQDGAINMSDIMVIAANFNKASSSYPQADIIYQ